MVFLNIFWAEDSCRKANSRLWYYEPFKGSLTASRQNRLFMCITIFSSSWSHCRLQHPEPEAQQIQGITSFSLSNNLMEIESKWKTKTCSYFSYRFNMLNQCSSSLPIMFNGIFFYGCRNKTFFFSDDIFYSCFWS